MVHYSLQFLNNIAHLSKGISLLNDKLNNNFVFTKISMMMQNEKLQGKKFSDSTWKKNPVYI